MEDPLSNASKLDRLKEAASALEAVEARFDATLQREELPSRLSLRALPKEVESLSAEWLQLVTDIEQLHALIRQQEGDCEEAVKAHSWASDWLNAFDKRISQGPPIQTTSTIRTTSSLQTTHLCEYVEGLKYLEVAASEEFEVWKFWEVLFMHHFLNFVFD